MHFNEHYNLTGPPDLSLLDVLARNPASRRVRWQPGTRMSYSNPGYAVAAAVLEQVTGRPYEDVIRERIFAAWHDHQQLRADPRRRSFSGAWLRQPVPARGSRSRRSISGRPATCTHRRPSWGGSSRCCSTGPKPQTSR